MKKYLIQIQLRSALIDDNLGLKEIPKIERAVTHATFSHTQADRFFDLLKESAKGIERKVWHDGQAGSCDRHSIE